MLETNSWSLPATDRVQMFVPSYNPEGNGLNAYWAEMLNKDAGGRSGEQARLGKRPIVERLDLLLKPELGRDENLPPPIKDQLPSIFDEVQRAVLNSLNIRSDAARWEEMAAIIDRSFKRLDNCVGGSPSKWQLLKEQLTLEYLIYAVLNTVIPNRLTHMENITPQGKVRAFALLSLYQPEELAGAFRRSSQMYRNSYDVYHHPRIPYTRMTGREDIAGHARWITHPRVKSLFIKDEFGKIDWYETLVSIYENHPREFIQLALDFLHHPDAAEGVFRAFGAIAEPGFDFDKLTLIIGRQATFYYDELGAAITASVQPLTEKESQELLQRALEKSAEITSPLFTDEEKKRLMAMGSKSSGTEDDNPVLRTYPSLKHADLPKITGDVVYRGMVVHLKKGRPTRVYPTFTDYRLYTMGDPYELPEIG